jgi:large repetitive protein
MKRHHIPAFWRRVSAGRTLSGGPRAARCYTPRLTGLEDRTLLSEPGGLPLPLPLPLGLPQTGTVFPFSPNYYVITTAAAGELTVSLHAPGILARVLLVDASGQPLVQSDAPSAGSGDGSIDLSVPAGENFIEVQSSGGSGPYQIFAELVPSVPAFQTVGTDFPFTAVLAAGKLMSAGAPADLVTPAGIYVGNGDGTFQSSPIDGPLGDAGWFVSAIAVGNFLSDNLPDIAYTEISPDFSSAELRVLRNEGGGEFVPGPSFNIDSDPVAIQRIDYGNGVSDLAVADGTTDDVAIFEADGHGGLAAGPILLGGSTPTAMTSGRFGDGYVDLVVADSGELTNGEGQGLTIFQSTGPDQFQLSGTIATASAPFAVVSGDFTGSGVLDLAVANENTDSVSVFLNRGDGTFGPPISYAVGQAPVSLVAADFGNGHVDLATTNSNSDDISVLLGNGDGTFQSQLRFGVGTAPGEIVSADFNDDGRPDLAVANAGSSDVSVLLGRGDGTFQDQLTNPIGSDPKSVISVDLNHDSYDDVVTADYNSNDVSVLMGNGDGTFSAARSFPAGLHPTAVVAGEFNGDGRVDLAVTDAGGTGGAGEGVSILLGNGDGTFTFAGSYSAGALPISIAAGDFTGNGILDLAVANVDSDDVTILFGDGHGRFPSSVDIPLGNQADGPISIVAGHFTGSAALDLAVGEQSSDSVSILVGNGQGGFVPPAQPIPVLPPSSLDGQASVLMALVAGDFLGNGSLQLAALSVGSDLAGTDQLSIVENSGGAAFNVLPPIVLGTGLSPTSMVAGEFFGTSALDLAIADQYSGTVSLFQGDGHGGFANQSTVTVGNEQFLNAMAVGDFSGSAGSDLAVATQSPDSVVIELNEGNGQFAPPDSVGLAVGNTPVVADFSGDGVLDVAIVDGAGDILLRRGLPNEPDSFAPPVTINLGRPSRDIAAVVTTGGTLLASVDATDNNVSFYAIGKASAEFVGSLATGAEPAQIVSADLMADGQDDLVIRNAGDGTLTVYMANPQGGFQPPETLAVGPGISSVTVGAANQGGLLDLLLANQTAGEVEIILNEGAVGFSRPAIYRAGLGLSAEIAGTDGTPASIMSQDATAEVAAFATTAGGPLDLVALDPGSDTLGILPGLGDGRFANPISLPTAGPTVAIAVADFTGLGNADLAILGPNGLSIWLGNGKGGFTDVATYDVGPDPTGLAVAMQNGDETPDLIVGNAFGDVLVLLGEGNGLFHTPIVADQNVGLAVGQFKNSASPTFVLVDQGRDQVVEEDGIQAQPVVVADRTNGLLVPGTPVIADLGGNGLPDLIVPNTGGDSVLVYPGLPGGGFGPSLNGGNGFFTGTNPVAVVVADVNGDGRPDLIVANEGSNDVSILLNEPTASGFTFVQGRRLAAGAGPVGLLYGNFTGDSIPDILVSDSASKELTVLTGVGDGFFNQTEPPIPLLETPGPIFAGQFEGGSSLEVVALDPGTRDLTLISGFSTGAITQQLVATGGFDPVAAFTLLGPGGFAGLVVANNGDGSVSFLQGNPDGLTLEGVDNSLGGRSPTGLANASIDDNEVAVFASTEGSEVASLLLISLSGLSQAPNAPGLSLLPIQESSLPLVATLLNSDADLETSAEASGATQGVTAAVVALSGTMAVSVGQGPFGVRADNAGEGDDGELMADAATAPPAANDQAAWKRVMMGLDEAFDEFRRATQPKRQPSGGPASDQEREVPAPSSPDDPSGSVSGLRQSTFRIIDVAIESLAQMSFSSVPVAVRRQTRAARLIEVQFEPLPLVWLALALPPGAFVGSSGTRILNRLSLWPGNSMTRTPASRRRRSPARVSP